MQTVFALLVTLLLAVAPSARALDLSLTNPTAEVSSPVEFNDFRSGVALPFTGGDLHVGLAPGEPLARASFTFLHQESSFSNTFTVPGAGTLNDPGDLFGTITTNVPAGLLPFAFNGPLGGAVNGSNAFRFEPSFATLLDVDLSAALPAGPVRTNLEARGLLTHFDALLFFNDAGAGKDRDFDDMVIGVNVAVVPEPGVWAIMLAGVVGVGAIVRRRRATSA